MSAEDGLSDEQVLRWRRQGDRWEGLVSRELVDGTLVTEWLAALVFSPTDSAVDGLVHSLERDRLLEARPHPLGPGGEDHRLGREVQGGQLLGDRVVTEG